MSKNTVLIELFYKPKTKPCLKISTYSNHENGLKSVFIFLTLRHLSEVKTSSNQFDINQLDIEF